MSITEAKADVSVGQKELGFESVQFELYIKHWIDILDS